MNALSYLMVTTLKNRLKELKKHPGQLIAYVFLIVMMVVAVISSQMDSGDSIGKYRDIHELYAIIFGLYLLIFISTSIKGLDTGASFYSMADVHLLFQVPLSSTKILFYGLIKQMGTALLIGVFLFFQYAWVNQTYGFSFLGMCIVFIGYALAFFCGQLTAMAIYSFSSSKDDRKKFIKIIFIISSVLLGAYIMMPLIGSNNWIGDLVDQVNQSVVQYIPVVGWLKAFVVGSLTGNLLKVLLGIGSIILYISLFLIILIKYQSDFYEDVLQATEVSFSAITAKKEGKMVEAVPKHIKIGQTGIQKGTGASVFFYKHLLENRRSRVFILDTTSLIFLAICIVTSMFLQEIGILAIFGLTTYMQLFTTALGRWVRELTLPYVYLIPAKPFKKLLRICQENLLKISVEAVILFGIIGLILKLPFIQILICIVARISFGLLFMAGNVLIERLFGTVTSKGIILMLYFFGMILLVIPGIVLGSVCAVFMPQFEISVGLLACSLGNILISLVILYMCRNILDYAELNQI